MKHFAFILLLPLLTISLPVRSVGIANKYAAIDRVTLQIPDSLTGSADGIAAYIISNFSSDEEKARAAYIWVAYNICYDVDNMYLMNFYQSKEDRIATALSTRKGICSNYAALFNEICLKAGLKSYEIHGYTKTAGRVDYRPHAWCGVMIDNEWALFDPTYGAGYIAFGEYIPRINNSYFKMPPSVAIRKYMPFDYLWQFLNYPVTSSEFNATSSTLFLNSRVKNDDHTSKIFFNYKDTLAVYEKQSENERLPGIAYRIERNGVTNDFIFERLRHVKVAIEMQRQNEEMLRQKEWVDLLNAAGVDFNDGVNYFNAFIKYRSNRFVPEKTDAEIQAMLDKARSCAVEALSKIDRVNSSGSDILKDPNLLKMMSQLVEATNEFKSAIAEHQEWLNTYFKKNETLRKLMF